MNTIQLSISLLVSDRMDTLGRCLNSLTPLLRDLDSELILVVTGTDKRVMELARQYTSRIVPFAWCSDFAKARNAGLAEARGEWFLYLDDDEWFEDVSEIVRFFQSGEYKNYGSAFYVQRNYGDWEGKHYTDFDVGRMCRRTPDTTFLFPVHEYLSSFSQPCKKFDAYVHHFGYLRKDEKKEEERKFDRNLPLLLKRLEDDEDTTHALMQLAMEYDAVGDYGKAVDYCKQGLRAAAERTAIYGIEVWMQGMLPRLIARNGDLELARETAETYLVSPRALEVARVHQCASLVEYCYELGDYRKGLHYVQEYHRQMDFLEKYAEQAALQGCGDITYASAEDRAVVTYFQGLVCATELENSSLIKLVLSWLPWEDDTRMAPCYARLEEWKVKYGKQEEAILDAYGRLKTDNAYASLQKALGEERRERRAAAEAFWRASAKDCPPGFAWQLVQMAVRCGFSLMPLVRETAVGDWENCVDILAERLPIPDMAPFCEKARPLLEEAPSYAGLLEQAFLERQLSQGLLASEQLLGLLRQYCKSVLENARSLYREEILEDSDHLGLPAKVRFALKLEKALALVAEGQYMASIALIREGLRVYPRMSAAMGNLTNYLTDLLRNPPPVISEEFLQLGGQVKQILKNLMAQEQWEEAYGVVARFVTVLPGDLEVLRMKQEILRRGQ